MAENPSAEGTGLPPSAASTADPRLPPPPLPAASRPSARQRPPQPWREPGAPHSPSPHRSPVGGQGRERGSLAPGKGREEAREAQRQLGLRRRQYAGSSTKFPGGDESRNLRERRRQRSRPGVARHGSARPSPHHRRAPLLLLGPARAAHTPSGPVPALTEGAAASRGTFVPLRGRPPRVASASGGRRGGLCPAAGVAVPEERCRGSPAGKTPTATPRTLVPGPSALRGAVCRPVWGSPRWLSEVILLGPSPPTRVRRPLPHQKNPIYIRIKSKT